MHKQWRLNDWAPSLLTFAALVRPTSKPQFQEAPMHPDLSARVATLESQLRHWRLATTCLAMLFAVVVLVAAASPGQGRSFPGDQGSIVQVTPTRIASRSFVLVGKDGTVYARLTAQDGVPTMDFYDARGNVIWSAPPRVGFVPITAQPMILHPLKNGPNK
jgi:hypothetical protein